MNDQPQPQPFNFHYPLIRKLEAVTPILTDEKQAIIDLPYVAREIPADEDIISIGARPSYCCVVVEGWACRYKHLPDGSRQIMSFHISGDIPDLQSLYLKRMDHSVASLTPITVAYIHHRDLHDLVRRFEGLAAALWRDTLVDAATFREWLVGVGRRSAHQRIAHLLCEMATKARVAGLANEDTYPWPVTQIEIADALGLSDVHVNRVIADLKTWGLVRMTRKFFIVPDWKALTLFGQFDPQYLHLVSAEAE